MFAKNEDTHWDIAQELCSAYKYDPILQPCWFDPHGRCVPVSNETYFLELREGYFLSARNCSREIIANGSPDRKARCKSVKEHFDKFYAGRFSCARILNGGHDKSDPLYVKLTDIQRAIPSQTKPDTHIEFRSGNKRYDVPRTLVFPLARAKISNLDLPMPRDPLRFFSFFRSDEDRISYPEYGQGCLSLAYRQKSIYYLFDLLGEFKDSSFEKIRQVEKLLVQCAFALDRAGYASFAECFNTTKF